jgi:UPF0042 nucleotide-binding protein
MKEETGRNIMRFVIVTGLSGAGKSTALKTLEDYGYFCVDNLPLLLISEFARILIKGNNALDKIALGIDIRSGEEIGTIGDILNQIKEMGVQYEVLFLESNTKELIKRYKETRRAHPLSGTKGNVEDGIKRERELLGYLKEHANYVVDTSKLLVRDLKQELEHIFVENGDFNNFVISITSFGFKYGIPIDADLVMDVRFLNNPFYVPELKPLSGRDKEVFDYVMASPTAEEFLNKYLDLLNFLIPQYKKEGKTNLVIGIGCTGGRHRSVAVAIELGRRLMDGEYVIKVDHRDLSRDVSR